MPIDDVFSLEQIFECGQCFRWQKLGKEKYKTVALGREVTFSYSYGSLKATCRADELEKIWKNYFDLDRDYAAIRALVSVDEKTAQCVKFGAGIRILKQDPWEALCSFIISQCNNIPRIQGIVERLCAMFGEKIGDNAFAFPAPSVLAVLDAQALAPIRSGYRAPYIISAARAVASGELDLEKLKTMPTSDAISALTSLPGVGIKVASCMALFGLHKLDAFPIDTWMKKALSEFYGRDFDPALAFGEYAGIAQQYIFYHTRESAGK